MKIQVILPDEEESLQPAQLVEITRAAEDLGYETAWLPDHILPPEEYGTTYGGVYEPLITIAHLSALTSRLRFGTSVLVSALRSPFVLAKQTATIDRLSGGRITLGIGIGWDRTEFANLGVAFGERAPRTDEGLRLLRHLFETGHGPFEGDYYGFAEGVFGPRPLGPIPLMVGGNSDAALRRVARYADVWQSLPSAPEEFESRVRFLRSQTSRPIEVGVRDAFEGRPEDIGELVEKTAGYESAGAEHLAIWFGQADSVIPRMTAFARARSL